MFQSAAILDIYLPDMTNSSDHMKVCTKNFVHAVQLPKPLCHNLNVSFGYVSRLHVPDSQSKPSCSRWNLRSLLNPQHHTNHALNLVSKN